MTDLVEVPCPLCGSRKALHLFEVRDYSFRCSDEVFGVKRCRACGCGYLSPRPPAERMGDYYPEEFYWSWEGAARSLDWSEVIARRKVQLEQKARWLEGMSPGRLLDIGAQKGEFLWYMQQKGWEVEGVEMEHAVPNPANMPIRYGDFLEMDFPRESFDCITMWAVLEHVYHPAAFIEKVSKLLRPGGRLVVLVTNFNSIQGRFYRADDYPRHLVLFTVGSAKRLCIQHGLRFNRWSTDQKIFGGSMAGGILYLAKRLSGYSQEELLREWKQVGDPDLYWAKFRGTPSRKVRLISRLDRIFTLLLEKIADRLGYGFILTFSAIRQPEEGEE